MTETKIETKIETNFEYVKQVWRKQSPVKRRAWKIVLAALSVLWLAGTITAFSSVAGIARLGVGGQMAASLIMGPFGLLWGMLKWTGVIEESVQNPNLLWLFLAAINIGMMWMVGKVLFGEPHQETMDKRIQEMDDRLAVLESKQLTEQAVSQPPAPEKQEKYNSLLFH